VISLVVEVIPHHPMYFGHKGMIGTIGSNSLFSSLEEKII